MAEEKRLTILGKFVVLLFVVGCLVAAARLFGIPIPLPQLGLPQLGRGTATQPGPAATGPKRRTGVLAEVRRRGALAVAFEEEAPPMYFVGPGQEPAGFEYQLARRLGAELGVAGVRFVSGDYVKLPGMILAGEADVIIAGYVPDPEVEGVEWSDSYLDFGLCLIVPQGSAVTDITHLAGRTIAVYDDPAAVRWVAENIPGATVRTYSGENGWFEAVESRTADALIYDYPFAAEEIKEHPRTKIVKFNLNQAHYAIGVPAANDELLEAINAALRRIKATPFYEDLVRRYLGYRSEEVTRPVGPGRRSYTVQSGDTLTSIAAVRLGAMDRWEEIWQLNRERIPNPHLIYPGYVLIMP